MTWTSANLRRRAGQVVEGAAVLLLVGAGIWYGRFAYLHSEPSFYQAFFGPAVMVAAGHGFENPVPAADSPFADFLAQRRNALAFADVTPVRTVSPDQFQYATRYLLEAVGYWWRFTGISWPGVSAMAAALHVLAVMGAYALLRLFLPLLPSLLGALWMCTSTLQLGYVPHVRDYSKGAFILAAIPLIVVLALRARSRVPMLAAAAAAGVVIGIGIGFKMDVAVMAPIAVVCVVLFRGRRPWTDLGDKALAVGVLTLALLVSAWPVLHKLSGGGSNAFHVILLGYAEQFDAMLGVEPSMYRFIPYYNDTYLESAVIARAAVRTGQWVAFPSPDYDHTSMVMWGDIVRHFPADVFARALAAVNGILNLVFVNPAPSFLSVSLPAHEQFRDAYLRLYAWNDWGAALGAMLVVMASLSSPRQGLVAAFLLLGLAGYPSLQFDKRHYFHLQIVPVLALLAMAWSIVASPFWIWCAVRARMRRDGASAPGLLRSTLVKLAAAVVIVTLLPALPLGVLRAYQTRHVDRLLSDYLESPRTPIDVEFAREGNDLWLARWPELPGRPVTPGPAVEEYYVLEFRAPDPPAPIAIGIQYRSSSELGGCPRVLTVLSQPGVVRFAFPVFYVPGQDDFEGVQLGSGLKQRLTGIYRMERGGPADLPIELRLPAEWHSRPLYQRFDAERRRDQSEVNLQVAAAAGADCRDALSYLDFFGSRDLRPDPATLDVSYTSAATVTRSGIFMDGVADTPASYLLQFKPAQLTPGAALVAQGDLEEGGLAIGLLKNDAWYGQVTVQKAGQFAVAVTVKDAGTYVPIVTNAIPLGGRRNRFAIIRFGLSSPDRRALASESGVPGSSR